MKRLCRACDDWHDLDAPWPVACAGHFKRTDDAASSLPRPMVISDSMGALRSMADGQIYESKSELRKGYKAKGVIELGSDAASYRAKEPERPKITKAEIAAAVTKVKQGYKPSLPTS